MKYKYAVILALMISLLIIPHSSSSQVQRLPKTPLPHKTLGLLADEISGQVIYNNEVILAGAPWIRDKNDFTDSFYESQKIYDIARSYGIDTVRLDRFPSDRKIHYAFEGEFWIVKPQKRLVARLDADTALVASGSSTVDITAALIYLPPLKGMDVRDWIKKGEQEEYKNKIALMWSQPRGEQAKALDAAGIVGVVS
ncbi:MAG: hypothetical protein OEW23_18315, partial [Candidatus Aminicenantes bacterium]|nr:hypothetical protein [Candidatus Aminicenantes bacterium]